MKSRLASHHSRLAVAAMLLISAMLLAGSSPALAQAGKQQAEYLFLPFDVPAELGAFTSAFGINNQGIIVGNFFGVDETIHGFVFEKGKFTDVAVPGSGFDRGSLIAVNDQGTAVGTFEDADTGVSHAFVRSGDGQITVLPDAAPDALLTEGTGINSGGTIVGFYYKGDGVRHGFILRNGMYTTYDYPGAARTLLTGINDRDEIVGRWRDEENRSHGFLLHKDGSTTSLDVPGAVQTFTGHINNLGQVVGGYEDEDGIGHGYLYHDGVHTTLDFPGAANTDLFSINDHGEIAGTYDDFSFGLVALPIKGTPSNRRAEILRDELYGGREGCQQ